MPSSKPGFDFSTVPTGLKLIVIGQAIVIMCLLALFIYLSFIQG